VDADSSCERIGMANPSFEAVKLEDLVSEQLRTTAVKMETAARPGASGLSRLCPLSKAFLTNHFEWAMIRLSGIFLTRAEHC
jgi:hypothetical protein